MSDNSPRLDLGQLRIQSKELLKGVRAGSSAAVQRARPYFDSSHEFKLTSAQLVIAREQGRSSWSELRAAAGEQARRDPLTDLFESLERGDAARLLALVQAAPNLAQVWRKSRWGWESALHVAAKCGPLDSVRVLVEAGADIYPVRQGDYPPVFEAYYAGQREIVEYLLATSSERDSGPPTFGVGIDIVCAGRIGMRDRVLMHLNGDPFAVYRRGCIGESVLHWPAHNGFVEVAEALLDAGAVIEADEIGLYGGKPLHWASEHEPTTVRLLLDRGANPNSRNLMPGDFEGFTPLHMCASQKEESVAAAEMLLAAGADPGALDAKDRTPREVAEARGMRRMVEFLGSVP